MILRMIFLIFPKGVDGRLLRKIMAESAESTIDKALDKALERLNVSREKEKIIPDEHRNASNATNVGDPRVLYPDG